MDKLQILRRPLGLGWFRQIAMFSVACGMLATVAGCGGNSNTTTTPGKSSTGANAGGAATRRIILLTNGNSPFWDAARKGLETAQSNLKLADLGFEAVLDVNDGTVQGQLDKLRQYGSQTDIAAVGVSVLDAGNAAIADEMRKLADQGIKIITVDSDVDRAKHRDARFAFVGTDNLAAGRELGIAARNLRPAGGEYVTFVGRTGAQNAIERVGGFAEGAGTAFSSLDNMPDDIDKSRARDNVRNAIGNHPGLNVLVGIWSYNAPAIVDVVEQMGRREDFTLVAFDAEPGAVAKMGEGFLDALVVQNPFEMGNQGVQLMLALVQEDQAGIKKLLPNLGQEGGDLLDTGLKVVVPDEQTVLKKEQFGATTQFLNLTDFKSWLAKYDLTGS